MKTIVVLTGLPASGKTTLGRALAERLGYEFIDKDDILESLFAQHSSFDEALRQRLSRESDEIFRSRAFEAQSCVLVSFWRGISSASGSGTAPDWIQALSEDIAEIHCVCDPAIAARRFLSRQRHPGHMDDLKDEAMLAAQFKSLAGNWPLRVGYLLEVDTSQQCDPDKTYRQLLDIWNR